MGDAHGDARLAGARRADEAQHAALDIGRELAHGQILCDPVLDLLKPEVLFVKHLARGAHIERFFRARVPRQIETNVQIIADDGRLRRAERLLLEPVNLFEQALLGVLRQVQGKDLFAVIRALGVRIVGLAELRLDDLHLLAQQILLLRLIQAVLRRFLKLMLQAEHTRLVQQHFRELGQSPARARFLQQLLLLFRTQEHMLGDEVRHERRIRAAKHTDDRLRRHVAGRGDVRVKQIAAVADERLGARRFALGHVRKRLDLGHEAGRVRSHGQRPAALDALSHNADGLGAGLLHHLLDAADRAYAVHIVRCGDVGRNVFLRDQIDDLIIAHGHVQRRDGHAALDLKGQHHARKHGQAAQRHHGQAAPGGEFRMVHRSCVIHSDSSFAQGSRGQARWITAPDARCAAARCRPRSPR